MSIKIRFITINGLEQTNIKSILKFNNLII